jgi:activator of HSP90 ATPase
MATEKIELSDIIPATPEQIYAAWLDPAEHEAMTGGEATMERPEAGAVFSAGDGYIWGKNLELEPHRRIVQSWRTSEFPDDAPDSRLEILLDDAPEGTRVTLIHSEIPEGQGAQYEGGWRDYYFTPMKKHFASRLTEQRARRTTVVPLEPDPSARGVRARKRR